MMLRSSLENDRIKAIIESSLKRVDRELFNTFSYIAYTNNNNNTDHNERLKQLQKNAFRTTELCKYGAIEYKTENDIKMATLLLMIIEHREQHLVDFINACINVDPELVYYELSLQIELLMMLQKESPSEYIDVAISEYNSSREEVSKLFNSIFEPSFMDIKNADKQIKSLYDLDLIRQVKILPNYIIQNEGRVYQLKEKYITMEEPDPFKLLRDLNYLKKASKVLPILSLVAFLSIIIQFSIVPAFLFSLFAFNINIINRLQFNHIKKKAKDEIVKDLSYKFCNGTITKSQSTKLLSYINNEVDTIENTFGYSRELLRNLENVKSSLILSDYYNLLFFDDKANLNFFSKKSNGSTRFIKILATNNGKIIKSSLEEIISHYKMWHRLKEKLY